MGAQNGTSRCRECGTEGAVRQEGTEVICETCGLVIAEDAVDRGPDWRSLDDSTDRRRTGAPMTRTRHDKGLSTEIGYGNGSEVDAGRKRRMARLRRQHRRAHFSSKAERNEVYAFTEIRRIVSALELGASLREQSCALFDSAQDQELLAGRSLEGFSAAAVYATCRVQHVSRTMAEIVAESRACKSELKAAYDAMNRELGLPVGPISPSEYIPRYASQLDLDSEIERAAARYAALLEESGRMGGKKPSGVAAACLYEAARRQDDDLTQCRVAECSDVSRMTIRSTVSDLEQLL